MTDNKTFVLSGRKSPTQHQNETETTTTLNISRKSSARPRSNASTTSVNTGGVVTLPRIEVGDYKTGRLSAKQRTNRASLSSSVFSHQSATAESVRNKKENESVEDDYITLPPTPKPEKEEIIAGMNRDELKDLEESFAVFDQNGEGTINASKLYRVMTSLIGDNPTEAEVQDLITANDADGGGTIEFDEYLESIKDKLKVPPTEKELKIAYRTLDRNHSGGINLDDLTGLMRALGSNFSQEDIEDMFDAVDKNGQKVITYEEFLDVVLEEESEEFHNKLKEQNLDRDHLRCVPLKRNYIDDLDLD